MLRKKDTLVVTYSGATTPVPDAIGKACPGFVYPNHEDFDYAKVELDPVSYAVAMRDNGVNSFDSVLQRQMLWSTLFARVIDGRTRAQDYADALLGQVAKEKNADLVNDLLAEITYTGPDSGFILKYMPETARPEYQAKIEAFVLKNLKILPGGPAGTERNDMQRAWFDALTRIAHGPKAVEFLRGLLDGKSKLPNLTLRQPERWKVVTALAAASIPDAPAVIAAELAADNTDMGQKAALAAEASIPTPAAKQEWWTKLVAPLDDPKNALTNAKLRGAISRFQSVLDEDLTRPFVAPFFAELPKLAKMPDNQYAHYFARLYPSLCEQSIVDQTTAALAANPDLPATVIKTTADEAPRSGTLYPGPKP